jgi:glycosyltransferase involved in cell wall biosynthesis
LQRVLILIRDLEIGGAQRQIALLARGLRLRGHDARIAVFYGGGALEAELASVPVIDLQKQGRWDTAAFLQRLRQTVRSFAPDCVYAVLAPSNTVAAVALVGMTVPVVFGIRASNIDRSAYGWAVRLSDRIEGWVSWRATRVIVNSVSGREALLRRSFPAEKLTVVRNGIDTERFRPDAESRKRERLSLGIAPDEKLIAAVGRLDPMKDHATFLKAVAIVNRSRSDLRFVVIGDGSGDSIGALRAQADSLGLGKRFDVVPARADIERVYPALDLLVVSSRFGEGFPNVLAEAMACGVQSVSTRVGDAAAIIGDEMRLVDPGDVEGLARAALRTLSGSTGEKPEERIRRLFPVATMVAETEQALRDVTAHAQGA